MINMTDEQIIRMLDEVFEYAISCQYTDYVLSEMYPEHAEYMVDIVRRCLYGSEEEG